MQYGHIVTHFLVFPKHTFILEKLLVNICFGCYKYPSTNGWANESILSKLNTPKSSLVHVIWRWDYFAEVHSLCYEVLKFLPRPHKSVPSRDRNVISIFASRPFLKSTRNLPSPNHGLVKNRNSANKNTFFAILNAQRLLYYDKIAEE